MKVLELLKGILQYHPSVLAKTREQFLFLMEHSVMRTRRQILRCFVPGITPLPSLSEFILSVVDFQIL